MEFNAGLRQMVDNISLYENGDIDLYRVKENLFGLYGLIGGRSRKEFADRFHEYWDFLEEICAVNGETEYKEKIETQIIPGLRQLLLEKLKDGPGR